MHKTFYIGLVMVMIGSIAGTVLAERGISAVADHFAISSNESQAKWGLNSIPVIGGVIDNMIPQPCKVYTCNNPAGCSYKGKQVAQKGDQYRLYDTHGGVLNPPKEFNNLLGSMGYGDPESSKTCPGEYLKGRCTQSGSDNGDINRALSSEFTKALAGTSGQACFVSKNKGTPTPTPTPTPDQRPTPTPVVSGKGDFRWTYRDPASGDLKTEAFKTYLEMIHRIKDLTVEYRFRTGDETDWNVCFGTVDPNTGRCTGAGGGSGGTSHQWICVIDQSGLPSCAKDY